MTTHKPGPFEPLVGQARHAKRMRMEMQCDPQWVLALAEERDQLRAECEKLRKDAERYRWLVEALDLALEYWRDRQQRYKNRRPKWVIAAESALAACRKGEE